jgi:hypothetical protein
MQKKTADTQTSLRLPKALRDRLQIEADAHGRGLGQEINERLEASFTTPAGADKQTAELLETIAAAARMLAEGWAPWHEGQETFAVFKDAVNALVEQERPEKTGMEKPHQAEVLFEGEHPGERLAMMATWRAA